MALPTLEKTWQFDCNQSFASVLLDVDNTQALFLIKQSLIGFGSGHWTVTSSSDGTLFDLTDNWGAYTDLNFAAGVAAHSWIVLTNSATGAQVCIDCNLALTSSEICPIYFSAGGGYATTGLAVDARPTPPADEVAIQGSGWGGSSSAWSGVIHVMMSTDGECTRAVICRGGFATGLWVLDAVKSPVTGWTNSNVGTAKGHISSDWPIYANLNDAPNLHSYITANMTMYLTTEGYIGGMVGQQSSGLGADSQSGGWVMTPIGLVSSTALHLGRKGALYDIWFGSVTRVTGDSYPNDTSYQFAQFGDIILPWDGTLPVVT